MYTLKSIARRGTALGMAFAVVAAAVMPAASVFADALNPLTERSLLLSSSAPGYQNSDGSGNSEGNTNSINEFYSPPGSGPNGQKTSETFTFTVSSSSPPPVKGLSFQYCTTAAGLCRSPGNNTGDADVNRDGTVLAPGNADNTREINADAHPNSRSDLDIVGTYTQAPTLTAPTDGEFQIFVGGNPIAGTDWDINTRNVEDPDWDNLGTPDQDGMTGKNNYITLSSPTGLTLNAGDEVKVVFKASSSAYITNPGYGSFFVKINTYNTDDESNLYTDTIPLQTNTNIIDGGVTVANVMTDSIHITTKVLETMSFSVGTKNRDTVDIVTEGLGSTHGKCDPIMTPNNNRLNLGNPNAEYSLETGKAWDVYSYWRLSSNSSGGATVYYSGDTLRNTVGDHIQEMATEDTSTPGTEQFGLGFVSPELLASADPTRPWLDVKDSGTATWSQPGHQATNYPFRTLASQIGVTPYNNDPLAPQTASSNYDQAEGTIDNGSGGAGTARFRFLSSSNTIPEVIAKQNETVISCATAKMRYVANIGADTPAGVYTTKINYLAAPQY